MNIPEFLFIVTPPNSGSTALASLLNSSPRSMLLTRKAEGQWLIPELCAEDRWNPEKYIDWGEVKRVWLERYNQVNELVGNIDIIIEKSPPNMVRLEQLMTEFPGSSCFAFIRDPYATCASHYSRYYGSRVTSRSGRREIFERLASEWIACSYYIKKHMETLDLEIITYESFCNDTQNCVELVQKIFPAIGCVDSNVAVQVKDYPLQKINNQNDRQVSQMESADIECTTAVLEAYPDILEYFGYELY